MKFIEFRDFQRYIIFIRSFELSSRILYFIIILEFSAGFLKLLLEFTVLEQPSWINFSESYFPAEALKSLQKALIVSDPILLFHLCLHHFSQNFTFLLTIATCWKTADLVWLVGLQFLTHQCESFAKISRASLKHPYRFLQITRKALKKMCTGYLLKAFEKLLWTIVM